jgi:signal peptidase I
VLPATVAGASRQKDCALPTALEPADVCVEPPGAPGVSRMTHLRRQLAERGRVLLRVTGGSMGPWMRTDDILLVRCVVPGELMAGAVVVYFRDGRLVVHRILRSLERMPNGQSRWLTKGDSAERPDLPVLEQDLLGRVTELQRGQDSRSLETKAQMIRGWLLAQISPMSRLVYPLAQRLKRFGTASESARESG